MMTLYIIALILPLALSLAFTPWGIRLALKINAIDQPDERKVHKKPIPRLGGFAVAVSFLISAGLIFVYIPGLFPVADLPILQPDTSDLYGIGICAALIVLLLGAWDDVKTLTPASKFFIQIVAATLAYVAGFKISLVSDPIGTGYINLEWLSFPITIVWIVGITNAFNLIDGLDGLASGTAVIALATIGTISFFHGQIEMVLITLMLAGAAMGFLWYNFRPAKVFLGDSGSLFLGFMLALLSIQSFAKVSTSFALLVPLLALGLPIMDTLLSMTRRFLSWFLPEKHSRTNPVSFRKIFSSIFQPDKSHVHHQLLQKGLSHKGTVLVLYAISAFFGIMAVAISLTTNVDTLIFIILALAGFTFAGISRLKYKEIALLHNGIFLALYNKLFINRQNVLKGIDCLFIAIAMIGGLFVTQSGFSTQSVAEVSQQIDFSLLAAVITLQFSVFQFSGLYRETIPQIGIADVVQITKCVGLASVISTAFIHMAPFWTFENIFILLFFNFYILITLVLGLRISFQLLKHLYRTSRQGNHNVLIYGAGEQGMNTLNRILSMKSATYTPIGFLDENPDLEGKLINGFKVYGGHWKLERLIKEFDIDCLFIAGNKLNREVEQRILQLAREYRLKLRICRFRVSKFSLTDSTLNKKSTKGLLNAN